MAAERRDFGRQDGKYLIQEPDGSITVSDTPLNGHIPYDRENAGAEAKTEGTGFADMTKQELRQALVAAKVDVPAKANKDELVALAEEHLKDTPPNEENPGENDGAEAKTEE